jgi:hypothetical protein
MIKFLLHLKLPIAIAFIVIAGGLLLLVSLNKDVIGIPSSIVEGNYIFGDTIGIVKDENEKPSWIIFGHWKTNLANQTREGTNNNSTVFDASFEMTKTDGTSKHTHTLTNFVLANTSIPNKNIVVFNGTSTISMKEGPIVDIPTSIQIINNTLVKIWLDPLKLDHHFGFDYPLGNGPIFGISINDEVNK